MTKKLFIALVLTSGMQVACGGMEPPELEMADPDYLPSSPPSTWPDAADLGVVVSSEVLPTDDGPPPPDFTR